MAESDKPSRADNEIAALRAKYEALKKIEETTPETLLRELRNLEFRRWWTEADKSWLLLAHVGYLTKWLVYIVGLGLWWLVGIYMLQKDFWDRPLGSIAVGDLVLFGGICIFWGWIGWKLFIPPILNEHKGKFEPGEDENPNVLMVWGMCAVAIAVIAGAGVLVLLTRHGYI